MPAAPGRTGAWKCCTLSSMGRWTRTPVGSARRRVPWVRCGGWPIASSPTCAARCRSDGLPSACGPIRRGYEGQKSGQSQRVDYAGEIGRTNTLPSQVVPYNAKVVQNFQEKLRAKYMAELPEICQFSAYTAFNLPA